MIDKEEIVIYNRRYKSVEDETEMCFGCVFYEEEPGCSQAGEIQPCTPAGRFDGKHIVWVRA